MPNKRSAAGERRRVDAQRAKRHGAHDVTRRFRWGIYKNGRPKPRRVGRRRACKKSLARFLRTYFPEAFYLPWSDAHRRVIAKLEEAILSGRGGFFALAMPRGSGKTAIAKRAALWALLYGHAAYFVIVGATGPKARTILRDIKTMLRFNDALAADFPEVCEPIRAIKGVAQRCQYQTYDGEPTLMAYTSETIVFPRMPHCPSSQAIIECVGITGEIRGRSYTLANGEERRPDIVLPDDPQTKASAKSRTECNLREEIIKGDVCGLAGPEGDITVFMPCTVIQAGDMADRMLNRTLNPDFNGERTRMIERWPDNMDLWDEYNAVRIEGNEQGDKGRAARAFYLEHREELEAGAVLSWPDRKNPSDLTGLQYAMNTYYRIGRRAFMAEYQNEPEEQQTALYTVTPEMVASRVNTLRRRQLPADAHFLVGFIDINIARGLHWVVAGFAGNMTGYCVDYGRWPQDGSPVWSEEDTGGVTEQQAVHAALGELSKHIADIVYVRNDERCHLDRLWIDCGYLPTVVYTFARSTRRPWKMRASRGQSSRHYREVASRLIGRPTDHCHDTMFRGRQDIVTVHHSDVWRTRAQKAFLLEPGAPGSFSFWGRSGDLHRKIAEEVCAEKLLEVKHGDTMDYYNWAEEGPNDFLDCIVGAMAGANRLGAEYTTGSTLETQDVDGDDEEDDATEDAEQVQVGGWGSRTNSFVMG